jgi:hypothetical protein
MNTSPPHEICLAGIVALSLVLPLTASAIAPKPGPILKPFSRIVWAGQAMAALGGLLVIISPLHPVWGFALALVSTAVFFCCLRRKGKCNERSAQT